MYATRVTVHIRAPRAARHRALVDPDTIAVWRVPAGMTALVHEFDGREGGVFRISLICGTSQSLAGGGKAAPRTDTYHGRFIKLVPDEQVVEVLEFETAPTPRSAVR